MCSQAPLDWLLASYANVLVAYSGCPLHCLFLRIVLGRLLTPDAFLSDSVCARAGRDYSVSFPVVGDGVVDLVLGLVCVAFLRDWHSRRFCSHLSAAAAFILCDGTWADKLLLALCAWAQPAFPISTGQPQSHESDDEDLVQAMALSLSATCPNMSIAMDDDVDMELALGHQPILN